MSVTIKKPSLALALLFIEQSAKDITVKKAGKYWHVTATY